MNERHTCKIEIQMAGKKGRWTAYLSENIPSDLRSCLASVLIDLGNQMHQKMNNKQLLGNNLFKDCVVAGSQ